ncbi:type I-C CRISPR-associated protein Cas7/Csd2, partial [Legionella drancourtii]|uniref:type I-C CRISPR-associated protein Cas7/Csd2 n=1 Tax=Legionella drancourtii TaxID=168933 RepID=UPI000A017AE5
MAIQNRYDFVLLFDVKDGNPNGDPDAGNLPRIDAETGRGLVTDVCLKRKVRNYIALTKDQSEITNKLEEKQVRYEIYIKEKAILNKQNERAYVGIGAEDLLKADDKKRKGGAKIDEARQWMCANFYDVRTFGAVMSTGVNCGQVRGPVQMTFARSVEPIIVSEHSITRMAVTTEKEAENQGGDNRTMGHKFTVPYGLYVAHGFVSASLSEQTGFNEEDIQLFWEALQNMFEHDRSAARGDMATRGLYVFKHESKLGNAQAHTLFDRIKIARQTEG